MARHERPAQGRGLSTAALVAIFLLGLGLLLYPTVSDYWNSLHQTTAIANYAETVSNLDRALYDRLWAEAEEYNRRLGERTWSLELTEEGELAEYESQLDAAGTGMMGYIEIAKIGCYLPIYHGVDSATLSRNIGHLSGTSLPVGGEGTHSVLSGHRGLTSARLFTDLDRLVVGDVFALHILDETLTYEVDQILIVLPYEVASLAMEEGADYCTLVTCTPYGVNSHRLLVRGHRVENDPEQIYVPGDALQLESSLVAPIVAAPMLLALLVWMLWTTRSPRTGPKKQTHREEKR